DFHVTGVQTCALPICQLLENLNFQGGCGGKIHVSPFCSQGNPTTTGPDQPCSAQPCARSDSQLGKAVQNRATSHLNQIFLGQIGNAQRHGGEVVDQLQGLDPQLLPHLILAERPMAIGQLDVLQVDGAGERE